MGMSQETLAPEMIEWPNIEHSAVVSACGSNSASQGQVRELKDCIEPEKLAQTIGQVVDMKVEEATDEAERDKLEP